MNKYIVDIVLLVWRTMFDRYYIDLYGLITFEQCTSCGKYSYGYDVNPRCADCQKVICEQCNRYGYCNVDFYRKQAILQDKIKNIDKNRAKMRDKFFLIFGILTLAIITIGILIVSPFINEFKNLFEFIFIVLIGVIWAFILIWIGLEWYQNNLIK